jgi:type IV secretion system protein VirB1
MDASVFLALVTACAPQVDAGTAQALVAVESGMNPHAIGVVGGALERQPRHRTEALATARMLQAEGWNFSIGLAQINVHNLERFGLSLETAFEPCTNLTAMQSALTECFERTDQRESARQRSLRQALSCYYSGNFITGFRHGYVSRVATAVNAPVRRTTSTSIAQKELP